MREMLGPTLLYLAVVAWAASLLLSQPVPLAISP